MPTAAVSVSESEPERERETAGQKLMACLMLPPLQNGHMAITFDTDDTQESA